MKRSSEAFLEADMRVLKTAKHHLARIPFDDAAEERLVWHLREEGLGATAKVPDLPENHEGWEGSSVPPEKLGAYLRDLKKLLDHFGYEGPLYGHFVQGRVHTRLTFDLRTEPGIHKFRQFLERAADLVVSYGGSLSGEHGDGQARGELLSRMYSAEIIEAFREFKAIWDPDWKLNPGKVVDPYPVDADLREGRGFSLPSVETHFQFPADQNTFAYAADRCVGAGLCRRHSSDGGVMCPSYMVTREEKHSTRGRARLLSEMIRGEVIGNGWRSAEVRDALDLCLSCKGCKHDCPVQVDRATYKAEFLSHYYERRLRPRYAYTSGLIYWWSQLAAWMPATANFFTQTPLLNRVTKLAAGYSQKREIPPYAPQTFREWFRRRVPQNEGRPEVILWPDTFNNHFTPAVAKAAVEVLEHAGYCVHIPDRSLCCGRPLYDYGMLGTAKRMLQDILASLREPIRAGTPVVGLEPSCMSVFRDELTNLLADDQDAQRLQRQSFLLTEFLHDRAPHYEPPKLARKAVVHGHCHHKSLLNFGSEADLLGRVGLDCRVLDSGCCGMAGSFGYESDHYAVGLACGERVLLPAICNIPETVLVIANSARAWAAYQRSTDRRIEKSDLVLVHCNSFVDGFWTDVTRTFCSGAPGDRMVRMYDALVDARRAAIAEIRPGIRASAIDRAARTVLTNKGFGDAFRHPTGHAVGFSAINHNALPRIPPCSEDVLQPGMVFNIEPAIYIDGFGGLRHCDMVLVTESGCEVLTPFQSRGA